MYFYSHQCYVYPSKILKSVYGPVGIRGCVYIDFWWFFRTQHRFLGRRRFSEKIFSKKFFQYRIFCKWKNHRDCEKPQGNSISLWFFTIPVVFPFGENSILEKFLKKFFQKIFADLKNDAASEKLIKNRYKHITKFPPGHIRIILFLVGNTLRRRLSVVEICFPPSFHDFWTQKSKFSNV